MSLRGGRVPRLTPRESRLDDPASGWLFCIFVDISVDKHLDLRYHQRMELLIQDASEYRVDSALVAAMKKVETAAVTFINEVLVPELNAHKENPEKYSQRNVASFPVPTTENINATQFVNKVRDLIGGKGFDVRESHDGAGLYATIVIDWNVKPVPTPRTIGRRVMGPNS